MKDMLTFVGIIFAIFILLAIFDDENTTIHDYRGTYQERTLDELDLEPCYVFDDKESMQQCLEELKK